MDCAEEHKKLFRFEDSIALVLLESTDNRSLIRPDTLAWMKRLSDKAATIPGVSDVSSLVALDVPRVNITANGSPVETTDTGDRDSTT